MERGDLSEIMKKASKYNNRYKKSKKVSYIGHLFCILFGILVFSSSCSLDKTNSYISKSIIEESDFLPSKKIYEIMQENFQSILGKKITNIEMADDNVCMNIESKDVDYKIFCFRYPSTDKVSFFAQYDGTEPKIIIKDMALFVQCFCSDKTYGDIVDLLKEQSHNWPEGTYQINSHFSIDGVMFYITPAKSNDGKKNGFGLEVKNSDIHYTTKDAKKTLRQLGNFEEENFKKTDNLTDEQAYEMVCYYKDHEMDYIPSLAVLAEKCGIDLNAYPLETSQEPEENYTYYEDYHSEVLHTCEQCGKSATHNIRGMNGYDEWYCDEHWNEMQNMLDYMMDN